MGGCFSGPPSGGNASSYAVAADDNGRGPASGSKEANDSVDPVTGYTDLGMLPRDQGPRMAEIGQQKDNETKEDVAETAAARAGDLTQFKLKLKRGKKRTGIVNTAHSSPMAGSLATVETGVASP